MLRGDFMNLPKSKSCLLGFCATILVATPMTGMTQSLKQVLDVQQQRTRLAQDSQQRIDKVVDQTGKVEEEYKAELKQIEGLKIYNQLLQRQIQAQEKEKGEIAESIDNVEVINRQIVPLMTNMIDSLDKFVELDVPFLKEERITRVARLRETLERQDVTVAEKFRTVMEAYQIENDYGRTIEAYKETLTIDDATREVDVLRVGRITLVYQTADGKKSGTWDQNARTWISLGNEYKNQIKEGLRIAKKQVAPDLLMLPVDAPEAG
jgi:hypothetical protein